MSVCLSLRPRTPPRGFKLSPWEFGIWWRITWAMFITTFKNHQPYTFFSYSLITIISLTKNPQSCRQKDINSSYKSILYHLRSLDFVSTSDLGNWLTSLLHISCSGRVEKDQLTGIQKNVNALYLLPVETMLFCLKSTLLHVW